MAPRTMVNDEWDVGPHEYTAKNDGGDGVHSGLSCDFVGCREWEDGDENIWPKDEG